MTKLTIHSDDKYVAIMIPRKQAMPLGTLLDACLDTVGNIEKGDVDLTARQLSKAEDNMIELSKKLMEIGNAD